MIFGTEAPGDPVELQVSTECPLGARHMYLDLTGVHRIYVMRHAQQPGSAYAGAVWKFGSAPAMRDTYRKPMRDEAYDQLGEFVGFAGKWKTTLPFPVQVVHRVEATTRSPVRGS
ncbi:MAG: hypothetical protein R2811_05590 [Flavobacteriales bacterium]